MPILSSLLRALQEVANLSGIVVIDVVEGTALASLPHMIAILNSRPQRFDSLAAALGWAQKSGLYSTLILTMRTPLSGPESNFAAPGTLIKLQIANTCNLWPLHSRSFGAETLRLQFCKESDSLFKLEPYAGMVRNPEAAAVSLPSMLRQTPLARAPTPPPMFDTSGAAPTATGRNLHVQEFIPEESSQSDGDAAGPGAAADGSAAEGPISDYTRSLGGGAGGTSGSGTQAAILEEQTETLGEGLPDDSGGLDRGVAAAERDTDGSEETLEKTRAWRNAGPWVWRTPLERSQPFWDGWYRGLSEKFLGLSAPKVLILAGTDRLDRPLTIGQMQGKFQMVLLPQVRVGALGY